MLRTLKLLLWKSYVTRKRRSTETLLLIIAPILIFIFSIRFLGHSGEQAAVIFEAHSTEELKNDFVTKLEKNPVLYAPSVNGTGFASAVMDKLKTKTNSEIMGFENEGALLTYYNSKNIKDSDNYYAVIFENATSDSSVPKHLQYKIRIASNISQKTSLLFKVEGLGQTDVYGTTKFCGLQLLLDEIYLEMSNVQVPDIQVQKFPNTAHISDERRNQVAQVIALSLFVYCSLLYLASLEILMQEKSSGTKELMKMNGVGIKMLWLAWYIEMMIFAALFATVSTVLLKVKVLGNNPMLDNSNPLLVWLFLMLFCSAVTTFSLIVQCVFSNSLLATSVLPVIWLLPFYLAIFLQGYGVSVIYKYLLALIPICAIVFGSHSLSEYEHQGDGLHWNNLFEGDQALGPLCIILVVDFLIYLLIACYLEAIMPGKYGVPKPTCFIFMPSFWRSRKVSSTKLEDADVSGITTFEPPSENLEAGVRIKNLHKVYYDSFRRNPKRAVNGVNLDIYYGEITALLGHNGAGKTTLVSILTGMISSSSGTVEINGYDVATNIVKARRSLGYCPQENLFCAYFTVLEHLLFFAQLKGCSSRQAKQEAKQMLKQLNLTEEEKKLVSTLSGGMKRRLCLGIALIGNSNVIILDEPTAGMDIEARRAVWDLLLGMRGQRVILISTHLMEEADILGDRVAIMAQGQIHCYATPLFLKKHYGLGFQLTLLKDDNCDINGITKLLQADISDVMLKNEIGSVVTYSLPYDKTDKFAQLFDSLERQKSSLGISGISMSIMTLDEVFLKVGEESKGDEGGAGEGQTSIENIELHQDSLEALEYEKLKGLSLFCMQMKTLLFKQILLTKAAIWYLLIQALIGVVVTAVMIALVAFMPKLQLDDIPLELTLKQYGETIVIYGDSNKQYTQQFVDTMKMAGSEPKESDNVTGSLLSVGERDLDTYNAKYIVAADFGKSVTALYSTAAYHSLPISLNLIMNSILSPQGSTIVVTNHPLNTPKESSILLHTFKALSFAVIGYQLMYITSAFIISPNAERVGKAKQLQYMSGVSPLMYWLSYLLWDFLLFLVIIVILWIIVFVLDKMSYFSGEKEIGVLLLLFALYGWSAIPTAYLFSYVSKTDNRSITAYVMVNMFYAVVFPLAAFFMEYGSIGQVARGISYILDLSPHFALTYALIHYSNQAIHNNLCKAVSCEKNDMGFCCQLVKQDPARYVKPYLAFPSEDNPNGLMFEVLFLAFDGFLYLLLLVLLDYNLLAMICQVFFRVYYGIEVETVQELDENVAEEQDYVIEKFEGREPTPQDREDIMLVDDLVKKYRGHFPAVRGVSFGVMKSECFGLLGCNGAGKTTVFKMLTGDEIPTRGDALIENFTLSKNKRKFLKHIGYCPQFDALNEFLTGRQIMQLYAGIRGIPRKHAKEEANKWLTLLGLQEFQNQRSGTYSGGTKRKLSTAVALIANPAILFLDEPTTGIDPVARRKLWNILDKKQKSGQSIVLTSHSMDECEALCGRLAIMVAGELVCIGPIPHLKQKFAQGFTIQMQLNVTSDYEDQVQELKNNFEQHPLFSGICELEDEHLGLLQYNVINPDILWSQLFKTMEDMKNAHSIIQDYVVTETTLEQVFLYFAKQETAEET